MKRILMALVLGFVFTVAYAQTDNPLKQGMPNTVTLSNGEVVYDLSGDWDAIYDLSEVTNEILKDIVKITQKGNEFLGIKLIGSIYVPKGSETIKGEFEKGGFKSLQVNTSYGWISSKAEIGQEGNRIVIMTIIPEGDRPMKITLTRK